MMKTFVTFGYDHTHAVNGHTIDKDCVVVLTAESPEECRKKAFELFGSKFCFEYPESHWDDSKMKYFPRGYIEINA